MRLQDWRLLRIVLRVGPAVCAITCLLVVIMPELGRSAELQWAPWVLGLLVLGIPHGAMDHRVGAMPALASRRSFFFIGYVGIVLLVLLIWQLRPLAALIGFLVVAGFHFGQGDLYWNRMIRNPGDAEVRERPDLLGSVLFLAVRGSIPVIVPVLAFSDEFAVSAQSLMSLMTQSSTPWVLSDLYRQTAIGLLVVLILVQLTASALCALRSSREVRRLTLVESVETGFLITFFCVVPPVLAMGVYFNGWHAVRHIGRLILQDPLSLMLVRRGRIGRAVARFHLATLPTTFVAVAFAISLTLFLRSRQWNVPDIGLMGLALASALTVPHVLVVLHMDRIQHVWKRTRGSGFVNSKC